MLTRAKRDSIERYALTLVTSLFHVDAAPRNPSAQGYINQQQHHSQYPQHAMGSPMLSPPVGFSPQQARGGSPGQFQPQGTSTMAPRSPGAIPQQPLPNMNMPSQYTSPQSNQGFAPQQPSYGNAGPDVNGLSQHMSHMNMASPSVTAQNVPFVRVCSPAYHFTH